MPRSDVVLIKCSRRQIIEVIPLPSDPAERIGRAAAGGQQFSVRLVQVRIGQGLTGIRQSSGRTERIKVIKAGRPNAAHFTALTEQVTVQKRLLREQRLRSAAGVDLSQIILSIPNETHVAGAVLLLPA